NVGDAAATATGTLSISDVDGDDSPAFNDQAATAGDNALGSFVLTGGAWTYTLDQSAVQNLDAGDVATDTITYISTDGTAQQITVTINGSDDTSVVTGSFTDSVVEGNVGDAAATATGTLSISDVDGDDSPAFNDQASTAGDNALGSFVLTGGAWTFMLDQSAVQNLDAGDVATDTITYTATDGTAQQITVTISGSDDASVVAGSFTDTVAEGNIGDATATATGTLSISDVDGDDSSAFNDQASTAGDNALGSFVLAGGTWTFTLDQSAVQDMDAGDVATDTITYTSTDGTAQQITVTINGSDDTSVVAGSFTDSVAEGNVGDAAATATGTLSISDVDGDDSPAFNDQASTAGDNALGSFVLIGGTWTFTLNQSAVQNLEAGDIATDTITYTSTDGTAQQITVTINGSDDASVVAGSFTDSVAEGNVGDAAGTATGTLSISDVDGDDFPAFNDQASTAGDNALGSFVLTGGAWTFTLDQSAVQNLDTGDIATDTITYTATDGSAQQITVTINGSDDGSVVAGSFADSVAEGNVGDAPATATGSLSISDVDGDDSPVFNDQAATAGDNALGSFVLTGGAWTYTLDQSAVQNLDAGDVATDTITYISTDGTAQQITVTINGSDDASVVAGSYTDSVAEGNVGDAAATATGTLSISDVDGDDSPVFSDQAATAGDNALGSFVLTGGNWTFTLDQSAVQDMDAGDVATDTITYTSTDGTAQQITVTINGSDDASVVAGNFTDSVAEGNIGDAAATATGTLSISDVDGDDSPVFNDQAATAGDNALGSFVLTGGTWAFTLDQSAVQDMDAGDVATDTITYTSTDGTVQQITVTINGSDDTSVVAGTHTDSVDEGDVGDPVATATGTLTISDADTDDSPAFNNQGATGGDNGFGSFSLAGGTWTYTLDQSTVQTLNDGDTATDTITYTATDGTTQEITVNVNGTNDAPIIAASGTASTRVESIVEQSFDADVFADPAAIPDPYPSVVGEEVDALTLDNPGRVTLTFESETRGVDDTLGWYQIADDGTIFNVGIVWENTDGLAAGSSVVLDLPAGEVAFFMFDGGAQGTSASYISDILAGGNDFLQFEVTDRFGADIGSGGASVNDSHTNANPVSLIYYDPDAVGADARVVIGNAQGTPFVWHASHVELHHDHRPRTQSGVDAGDDTVLTIGFEMIYNQHQFNDVVFTVEIEEDVETAIIDVAPNVTLTDVDNTAISSASAQITLGRAGDTLALSSAAQVLATGHGIVVAYDATTGTLTFTAAGGDVAHGDFADVLQGIQLINADGLGDESPRNVEITVNDSEGLVSAQTMVELDPVAPADPAYTFSQNDFIAGDEGANTISGLIGDDIIFGDAGDDTISGGVGSDTLNGGDGSDTYVWQTGDESGAAADTVLNFAIGGAPGADADILDFSDLLDGESGATITNFLQVTEDAGSTVISVNVDGAGGGYGDMTVTLDSVDLTALYGTTDQSTILQNLITDGHLNIDNP
ncbi:MAG: hypothetical protein COA42_21705, partial [Alteromonadaceae bacterium]